MDLDALLLLLAPILETLSGKYGIIAQVISILIMANGIVKTLETAAKAIVAITPSKTDDAKLNKILSSKPYYYLNKVFGILLNVKLPTKP